MFVIGTAIFIMYNYSRLNAIIHEYEDRVQKKFYPSLPPVDSVDFSVLKEEVRIVINRLSVIYKFSLHLLQYLFFLFI